MRLRNRTLALAAAVFLAASGRAPAADPTDHEQLMLEMINRMRWDPAAELHVLTNTNPGPPATWQTPKSDDPGVAAALTFFDVNADVLATQWAALTPRVAPLAWNSNLHAAAAGHNAAMIAADQQSHQVPGEPGLAARLTNAGYAYTTAAENIYAYADSVFYGHAGFAIDWGGGPGGIQAPPGHRNAVMNGNFREVGIAITPESDPATAVGPLVITQDFGRRSGNAFVTGVAYRDGGATPDYFYTPGEGLSGVAVQAYTAGTGTLRAYAMTSGSGGYTLQLAPGTYDVTLSDGALGRTIKYRDVRVDGQNVKLDTLSSFIAAPGAAWNAPESWSAGVPNGPGTTAVVGRTIPGQSAGPRAIAVNAPVLVGKLLFEGSNPVTVGGAATLTFAGGSPTPGSIDVRPAPGGAPHVVSAPVAFTGQVVREGAGTLHLTGPQQHAAGAAFSVRAGRTDVGTNAGAPDVRNLRVFVDGPATRLNYLASQDLMRLEVEAAARVALAPGGEKVLVTEGVLVTGGAALDLTDNALMVDYTSPNDAAPALVRALTRSAYAGGAWTGPGITSSTAAAVPNTAVGYAHSTDVFNFRLDQLHTFFDRVVDETAVLVRYTLEGDTNLDGAVTFTDFLRLREGLSSAGEWSAGDFDYDGRVTARDYAMLRRNFGESLVGAAVTPSAAEWAAVNAFGAVVPEPATGALLVLTGSASLLRRRRRHAETR